MESPGTIPPSAPNSSARRSALVFVSGLVGLLVVLLVILVSTQGAYLKSQIFSSEAEDTASGENTPVDDYTNQEAHCREQAYLSFEECLYAMSGEAQQKEAVCNQQHTTCQDTCGISSSNSAARTADDPCLAVCEETYYLCLDEAQDYLNAEHPLTFKETSL